MQIEELVLVLKIKISPWEKDKDGRLVCYWDCPHGLGQERQAGNSTRNIAAIVEVTGVWPFKMYAWAVYAPFGSDEAILDGDTADETDAKAAARDSLKKLIANADGTG
jgi:hypothetical protein